MDDAERLRDLAEHIEELCGPVERELALQLQSGDFAGTLADEAEDVVADTGRSLGSMARGLRDIADERSGET